MRNCKSFSLTRIDVQSYWLLVSLTLLIVGCKKFLDVGDPIDKVSGEYVFKSNASAAGVLSGIYYSMQDDGEGFTNGRSGIPFLCTLSGDDLNLFPISVYTKIYNNEEPRNLWSSLYKFIFELNSAIEGISSSNTLSKSVKNQLLGESLFVRAFCYFNLVNLYGDVPLLLTTDYKENSKAIRDKEEVVYQQIIIDLLEAKDLLSEKFLDSDAQSNILGERIRPSKWAAFSLLARVYLYTNNWKEAEKMATLVIENESLFDIVPLSDVFLKNNKEAIWQLQTTSSDGLYLNPLEAKYYIPSGVRPNFFSPFSMHASLLEAIEPNDLRQQVWMGRLISADTSYYYPLKYKEPKPSVPSSEYLVVLRLAEQYLIRSEARAQMEDFSGSAIDLNVIRQRASLSNITADSKAALMGHIMKERRIEFFAEGGHRWFDMKRWGIIDTVMATIKKLDGYKWEPYKKLFPIPIADLNYNANLVQNAGYPSR